MSFSKYERWMEGYALKTWESTLDLCVLAHGHDVDPIMEASCNNNYFLDIISSGIGELILGNHGSDHMFFLDPISRTSWSTCLLQSNTPVQPLLWFVVEYYPSGISRISWKYITSYGFFINCYFSPIPIFLGTGLSSTENTDKWINSALRFNNSK